MFRTLFSRIGRLEAAPPWGLGAAVSALVAALAALLLSSTIVLSIYCGIPANAPYCSALNFSTPPALTFFGWTLGAALTAAFVWFTRRTAAERAALRLGGMESSVFWVLLVSVGLAVTIDLIIIQFTGRAIEPELQSLRQPGVDAISWILAMVFMAVAQPAAEELVFRGVAQPALRQALGAWPGYLLTAVLYALFHVIAYSPSQPGADFLAYGLLLPLVNGVIFGAVRLVTGSTRAAVLAHAAFGAFAVLKVLALG